MDLGIKDRLAVVTGASRGIGRSIALALAREGARLILVARSPDRLEAVRSELPPAGKQHLCFAIDLMADDGVPRLVKAISSEAGAPDILVHNLGGSFGIPAMASAEDWTKVWHFNVAIGHELEPRVFARHDRARLGPRRAPFDAFDRHIQRLRTVCLCQVCRLTATSNRSTAKSPGTMW